MKRHSSGAMAALVLGTAAVVTGSAMADSILFFSDGDLGTNAVPGALTLGGRTATTATSYSEFETLLTGGSWDLVIFAHQNFGESGSVFSAVSTYINGGGKVLGTTWQNGAYAAAMQATAASTNTTPITTDTSVLFDGLGATIDLVNPGWGIWTRAWNPTGSAYGVGALGSGFAGIVGNDGRTILWGPLFDTFDNLGEGELLLHNSIEFLLGATVIPLPAPVWMGLAGLGGIVMLKRRRAA